MDQECLEIRNRVIKIAVFSLVLLTSCQFVANAQQKTYNVQDGVAYSTVAGIALELNIAWPTRGTGPFAAIMFLPGNGWGWWQEETRNTYFVDIREAAKRGYVAVAVDYRLASDEERAKTQFTFPAQLYDVKAAVRWLRTNATAYNIDPGHIGAVGFSSGAHLALMLGLTVASDGFEGYSADQHVSSGLQAVVSIAAPTELASVYNESVDPKEIFLNLIGCSPQECAEKYREASPLNYARHDNPPILIIHGEKDLEIPVQQALLLDQKLNEVGASHKLVILKDATHENVQLNDDIWEFLKTNLQN
jgi:acetyl esterase/lipase